MSRFDMKLMKIQINDELRSLLPPLCSSELESLRLDIETNGILVPIVVDENGVILDGHHRYQCDNNAPYRVVSGLSDDEKKAYTIRANMARRNLSPDQKKEVQKQQKKIAKLLRESDPKRWTQTEVAKVLGVDRSTISLWFDPKDTTNVNPHNTCTPSPKPDARVKVNNEGKKEIVERVQEGESQEQVAADFGITQQAVSNILKKHTQSEAVEESKSQIVLDVSYRFDLGDFEDSLRDVPDGSVDLILTDPPYPFEFIECWTKLARFAKAKLKPHGFCIAYSGQLNLPEVCRRMSEHLDYVWTCALIHAGTHQYVTPRNLYCGWKPLLIYQNGFKKPAGDAYKDIIDGAGMEKSHHRWQQAEAELVPLIEYFSNPGDTILEPFAGGGTTIAAALRLKRNVIASEIDPESYLKAKKRVVESLSS